jgi:hypothetical protein
MDLTSGSRRRIAGLSQFQGGSAPPHGRRPLLLPVVPQDDQQQQHGQQQLYGCHLVYGGKWWIRGFSA